MLASLILLAGCRLLFTFLVLLELKYRYEIPEIRDKDYTNEILNLIDVLFSRYCLLQHIWMPSELRVLDPYLVNFVEGLPIFFVSHCRKGHMSRNGFIWQMLKTI